MLAPHAPDVRAQWVESGVEVKTFRYAPEVLEVLGYSRSLDADERARTGAMAVAPLYVLGARRAIRSELERRTYDLLHAHWIVPNGVVAAPFGAKLPLAIGLHGSDVFMAEKSGIRRLASRALRRSALLTGCSPELVDRVCRLGDPPRECHVIPYGVGTMGFSPHGDVQQDWRQELGIPREATVALSVGRMATKKGYQVLLPLLGRLFQAHPNLHLVLAGAGDRLQEFERQASQWAGRVHFPGLVYRQGLPDLYRSADLFVLPAVHDRAGNVDGLPNVILEAMASGLPVVASEISGIPLAVEDGRTGLLVPEGDDEALYRALDRLAGDRREAEHMGRAARAKAVEELTWDAIAARYEAAYEAAVG